MIFKIIYCFFAIIKRKADCNLPVHKIHLPFRCKGLEFSVDYC